MKWEMAVLAERLFFVGCGAKSPQRGNNSDPKPAEFTSGIDGQPKFTEADWPVNTT